jgi:hypothetical protein
VLCPEEFELSPVPAHPLNIPTIMTPANTSASRFPNPFFLIIPPLFH